MLSRILDRIAAMTRRQQVVLAAAVTIPVALVSVLLVGVAAGRPEGGAAAALVLITLTALAMVIYVIDHRRRIARAAFEAAPVAAVTAVSSRQSEALTTGESFLLHNNEEAQWLNWQSSLQQMPARSVLAHGLATRSDSVRDHFALKATEWRFDAQTLHDLLAATESDQVAMRHAVGPCDPNALVMLARLLLGQRSRTDDRGFARLVQRLALMQEARLSPLNRQYLAQHLLLDGEVKLAAELIEQLNGSDYPARFFHLDLVNPFSGMVEGSSEAVWLAALGGVFRRSGLEPLDLLPTGGTPFDRLHATAPASSESGPKVTVIMTCFEPGEGLLTAVRSMLGQTWTNWELIVTDDASPSSPDALFDQVAAMDARIRIVRNPLNAGTYVRRNEAIRLATGEFVTMQDSDDWVHPRRLELQMRHLLENPKLPANLSQSVRLGEDLMFVQPRGASIRLTESSILFRKDSVRDLIGDFDTVRKAADSEFRVRLESTIGYAIPLVDVEAPLSMVRFDRDSLSGGDLGDGWMHPARVAYRSAQRFWRDSRVAEGLSLKLDATAPRRAFPAHAHLTGTAHARHELDVLMLLDPRRETGGTQDPERVARELERLATAGLRVGFRRADEIVPLRPPLETHPALQALVNAGTISEVLSIDDAATTTLVVRYAASLAAISALDHPLRAEELVVVEDGAKVPTRLIAQASRLLVDSASVQPSVVSGDAWQARLSEFTRDSSASATVTA